MTSDCKRCEELEGLVRKLARALSMTVSNDHARMTLVSVAMNMLEKERRDEREQEISQETIDELTKAVNEIDDKIKTISNSQKMRTVDRNVYGERQDEQ